MSYEPRNFKRSEFNCKCCGKEKMQDSTLKMLDEARDIADIPFIVNSGWRCETHNRTIGSNSDNHPSGYAGDIQAKSSRAKFIIVEALIKVGFNRIGIADTFIHVDNNPKKDPKVIWDYN